MTALDPKNVGRIILDQFMPLTGYANEKTPFYREVIWEQFEDRLPKSALARVRFHFSEVLPDTWSGWHVHNGPGYHLVLQGRMALDRAGDEPERVDEKAAYVYRDEVKAGEALTEPVGIPHRAGNPDPEVTLIVVTFLATDADRHHIVPVGEPPRFGSARYPGGEVSPD